MLGKKKSRMDVTYGMKRGQKRKDGAVPVTQGTKGLSFSYLQVADMKYVASPTSSRVLYGKPCTSVLRWLLLLPSITMALGPFFLSGFGVYLYIWSPRYCNCMDQFYSWCPTNQPQPLLWQKQCFYTNRFKWAKLVVRLKSPYIRKWCS